LYEEEGGERERERESEREAVRFSDADDLYREGKNAKPDPTQSVAADRERRPVRTWTSLCRSRVFSWNLQPANPTFNMRIRVDRSLLASLGKIRRENSARILTKLASSGASASFLRARAR